MSNWQQRMTELGVTENDLSAKTRKLIKTYLEFQESIEEANNDLSDPSITDRKRSIITKKRDEILETMNDMDEHIVDGIDRYNRNKDSISRSKERMQKYWSEKKGGGATTVTTNGTQPVNGVIVETPAQTSPVAMASSGQQLPKSEKKGYGTTILLGGLLLVLSLGAVNYFKRD